MLPSGPSLHNPPKCLRQGLSLSLEFTNSAMLVAWELEGPTWEYRCTAEPRPPSAHDHVLRILPTGLSPWPLVAFLKTESYSL